MIKLYCIVNPGMFLVILLDFSTEVASWTRFDQQFIHASTNKPPNEEEKTILMASIMAMGTNIGLTKMADATQGLFSFKAFAFERFMSF